MRGVCTYDIRSLAVLDVYISGAAAPDSAVEADVAYGLVNFRSFSP